MKAIDYAEKAENIFVLPDSFIRIKELIDDEESTIDDIAEVILLDPALSATILKLANSTFFSYPGKIDTISKAVLVLGITEVYNVVIAYFTTDAFKALNVSDGYLETFWQQSVDCALLVKFLGTSVKVKKPERLFILGLLHNLGELVLQQFCPDKIEQCECNEPTDLPWVKQEEVLGFTYGECTSELLKVWQLPYSLIEPIRYQDESDFSLSSQESQLLYIAKRIMLINQCYSDRPYKAFIDEGVLETMHLDEDLLAQAKEYCDLERFALLSILNPGSMMVY